MIWNIKKRYQEIAKILETVPEEESFIESEIQVPCLKLGKEPFEAQQMFIHHALTRSELFWKWVLGGLTQSKDNEIIHVWIAKV